eukprot:m.203988 g.203988  ORF g.203988 m.203988 type:complete len:550 (-) comp25299_c0_seq3:1931-3580(-)
MAASWGELSRQKAEGLVGTEDGTFLVRNRLKKGGGIVEDEFVLTVVFKGKPTHHSIKRDEAGVLCVNNKPHGGKTTLEELIEYLGQKRKGWPVALDKPVAKDDAAAPPAPAVAPAVAEPVPDPEPTPEAEPSKADTEETLANDTAATAAAKADVEEAEARAEAEEAAAAAAAEEEYVQRVAKAEQTAAAEKAAAVKAAKEAADAEEEAAAAAATAAAAKEEAEQKRHRPKLTTLGISSVFRPSSPETERKPGVPWGKNDLNKTAAGESSTDAAAPITLEPTQPFKLATTPKGARRQSVNVERRPLGAVAQRTSELLDKWDRNVPQHKVRVFEVLRSLFSEAQESNPQKLLLSREDLATRFTLVEITPVLQGIGAFDQATGSFKLTDVFDQAEPLADGTVSLAKFLQACDPEQAAQARAKAEIERSKIEEERSNRIADEAAKRAAEIEAERRANETMLVEVKKAELVRQQETQEKLYQEHLARLEEMQRAERSRIQNAAEAMRLQQEGERKRAKEARERRMRERREAWKARQLPMPWDPTPTATEVNAMV